MQKWTSDEEKNVVKLITTGLSHKEISKITGRTIRSIERKLSNLGYKSTYRNTLHSIILCEFCKKEFSSLKSEHRKFCSKKCSIENLNRNVNIDYNKTKISKCVECGHEIKVKINTNTSNIKCDKCKKKAQHKSV